MFSVLVVEGDAGLLLLRLSRVICRLFSLSLLATVRGGTSLVQSDKETKQRKRFPTIGELASLACSFIVSGT